MIKKRVNKINWHGSDLENNRAKAPNISTPGGNGLDGLNDGEIYVCNADEDPAIFIKTNKDKVARVGGNGSDSYSRDQIDDFLGKKLDKVVWDRNLEERVDDNGEEYLFLTKPLITAYGVTMYSGADVQVPSIYEGLPIDGVTIQWVDGKLVATGGKGTANGIVVNGNTYTPNEDGIITLPNYPTSLEWGNISGKPSWIGSTKPSYSWDEIGGKPSVFPTNWENVSDKPSWIGATKPTYDFSEIQNKPTTIAGYGITDAYTKNDISGLLSDYVTKSGAQDITGVKSFINGLNIGDILVKKHSDGVVELDGDLILTGSLTMFAQGSHTASTILDALPIDETTLSKEGGVLSVIGGVGGGSVDGIILNGTTYSPDEATKLITLPNYPTTLPASDVYSWAKQPNKPSYSFSELSSHPTTLGGYGITDAYTKHEINTTVYSKSECDEFFVNKAGDTMTGKLLFNADSGIDLVSIPRTKSAISFNNAGANRIGINFTDGDGNLRIAKTDINQDWGSGDVNILLGSNNYKVWHAGNDGSGSGLDADLLDGKHLGNVGDRVMRQIGFPYYNEFGSNDTNVYLRKVLGWCYNNVNTGASDTLFVGVGHPNALGNMQIQLYCADGINSDGYPRYSSGVFFPLDGLPYIFGTNDYNYYQHTLATTDGNVYSATKLQTPRTIFSKPFDGTNNVTGGAKFLNICIETDNNGNDSGRSSEINNYNGELHLQYNTSRNITMCLGGGNVGIGTTSPAYKLHVTGSLMCEGEWIRNTGDCGWYNATHNGGIYMTDNTYVKVYGKNWFRSNLYSAGIDGFADDSYSAAYNACAPNNDNYCCYSIVRSGTIPLGIGFNTKSEIWLGTVNTNRKAAAQWLQISGNRVTCSGDILAYGGITMYGSDETKKNIIERFILPLDYVVNAPLWRYTWRDNRNDRINIGGSAQYTQLMMNELVGDSDKGLTMDYATTAYAFSVSIAKHFQEFLIEDFNNHETRIEFLERENKELKDSNKEMMNRIIELERRAA